MVMAKVVLWPMNLERAWAPCNYTVTNDEILRMLEQIEREREKEHWMLSHLQVKIILHVQLCTRYCSSSVPESQAHTHTMFARYDSHQPKPRRMSGDSSACLSFAVADGRPKPPRRPLITHFQLSRCLCCVYTLNVKLCGKCWCFRGPMNMRWILNGPKRQDTAQSKEQMKGIVFFVFCIYPSFGCNRFQ